jgi:hypothetical protein
MCGARRTLLRRSCSARITIKAPLAIPALYLALKKEGVPAELHIYNSGGYGFGYRPGATPVIKSTWVLRLQDWMSDTGMSPAK